MTSTPASAPRRRALLIGIDAYEHVAPLSGCVNDVDAVETVLLDRLHMPKDAITKLTAPHAEHKRSPRVDEKPATSANIRAALGALAEGDLEKGDRVLIWYCGHGTQIVNNGARTPREALVPVDIFDGGELVYDYSLHPILRRIADRCGDLTVILDCCCSAGATRSALRPQGSAVRFCRIDIAKLPGAKPAPRYRTATIGGSADPPGGLFSSLDPSDPGYTVAASCQSNERAHEGADERGATHGAFTAALLEALTGTNTDRLEALRWVDVWQSLREKVSARYPGQHPILLGRGERRLFGGPFRLQDPGYPIARDGSGYRIHAGTLAGLSQGARVAVYGPELDRFPPLNSGEDFAARLGVLQVKSATPSSCSAAPVGADLKLVDGARGRLIAPGRLDALVVGLDPYDAALAKWIENSGRMRVVPEDNAANEIEDVFVGTDPDGTRWIGDDVYGSRAGGDGEPPLVTISPGDREGLLQGLNHYVKYNLPLRMARRCRDLPGALRVYLLDCRNMPALTESELQDPPLPLVQPDSDHRFQYAIEDGQPVCIAVENQSSERLYASLINCATSGRVELLGGQQVELPPGKRQTFWMRGHLGKPFACSLPDERSSGVDRLIAIATTVPDVDLSFLRETKSFKDALRWRYRDMTLESEPRELWTATLVTMKIGRDRAGSVGSP